MSKDIRSFFSPAGGSKKSDDHFSDKKTKCPKKRIIISDSDDSDDNVIIIPTVKKSKQNSETGQSKDAKKDAPKVVPLVVPPRELTAVQAIDIFGCNRIKRSAEKTVKVVPVEVPKQNKDTISSNFDDTDMDFEETLLQLDAIEAQAIVNVDAAKNDKKRTGSENQSHEPSAVITKKVEHSKYLPNLAVSADTSIGIPTVQCKTAVDKESKKEKEKKLTPVKPTENDEDEPHWMNDPAEKRRLSAIGYQRYLQREGPKHLGSKIIPKGKHGCLNDLKFVVTGVLDSIEREAAVALIQECGGKVTSSVSKNTSYVVVGEDAGPAKVTKAKYFGITQLNEDKLFELIRTKSSEAPNKIKSSRDKEALGNVKKNKKEYKQTLDVSKSKSSIKDDDKHPVHISSSKERDLIVKPAKKVDINTEKPDKKEQIVNKKVESAPVSLQSVVSKPANNTPPSLLWVDKYRPTNLKQIIGQQGDRSNVQKLMNWLKNWHNNHFSGKKLQRPSPWDKDDNGAYFKAALLSGPPGVGKTTTAHLVCKELGFDFVEFNASDTRSKRLLHEEVSELLSSKSLYDFFRGGGQEGTSSKHVLIMDEVDGMAGNEDRGGIAELIQLIKNSKVPVICMCNDHNHQKIRSLTNYCYDLRFNKPRVEQIKGAMLSVCFKEGVKLPADVLTNMIIASSQDVRQVLHHLSLLSAKESSVSTGVGDTDAAKPLKNIKLGPWDVLKKVFSSEDHKSMTINDKSDLFFHDYSLAPLFVQENYLSVEPDEAKKNISKRLDLIATAADSICWGDVVDKTIRSKMAWGLLPVQAMYASVVPGTILESSQPSQISFPSWLGKNSRRNKFDRLLQELHMHSRLSTSGNKQSFNEDYLSRMRDRISKPLINKGLNGVAESLNIMQSYHLLRSDIDSIMELGVWPKEKDPMFRVDSKVKAALTRSITKECSMLPYSTASTVGKKKTGNIAEVQEGEMEGDDEDDGEEVNADDVTADPMIKAKKRPAPKKEAVAGPSGPKRGKGAASGAGSSQKGGAGKGKSKK